MKQAIATVSIAGDLREKLAAIAAAGFDGVEIFENDFLAFDGSPADVGKLVRDHGLEIALFQPFRDFEGLPPDQRTGAIDRAERKFDLMNALGTDLVLICSNVSPLALGGIDRAADDLAALGDRARAKGIRLGYEALAWGRHVSDHRDAWEIVRRADHPNVGLILDSFHTLVRHIDPQSVRAIPADKIFFVQVADAPAIVMDPLYLSRHFRCMPGQGDLDNAAFVSAVAATGYDDWFSLEIFNDQFRTEPPHRTCKDGHRALVNLMDQVARVETNIPAIAKPMPGRIAVDGIEFIEFTADEAEAAILGQLFSTMGFHHAGTHKSKDVSVWRQGNINLVINTEREGFAHATYLLNGTSVCDVGLRVANAAATLDRAQALGIELFHQPVASGELEIPAIRDSGGGLLHFVDSVSDLMRVWETEFTPGDDPTDRFVGLTEFDHIAETLNLGEMLSWSLFYTALFDTHKSSPVDVVDPGGLVRSQAIQNDDGTFRLTLNGAENQRTLAGRFLADSLGSGVQHVAFACADILETADRLAARGFKPLEISPNYYDDLGARFGLDQTLLTALQHRHILYDRDDRGEFFQLYSQLFGDGYFFEIVERRAGYDGYGAANAPFRIAAQRRSFQPAGMPRI